MQKVTAKSQYMGRKMGNLAMVACRRGTRRRKIKKVLLVEPPRTTPIKHLRRTRPTAQPPLGPAYIAAVLEKEGYEVRILDAIIEDPNCRAGKQIDDRFIRFGLEDQQLEKAIEEFKPDIVGASCIVSAKYNDAINVCRLAKKVNPEIVTVMGGAHPTMTVNSTLQDSALDYVMIGEADFSTLGWIRWLEGKRNESELDGVGTKVGGKVQIYPKKEFIQNLDEIPFPARHLLKLEKYWEINLPHGETTRSPWTTIVTSRGCPATCIYCSAQLLWGNRYRGRSAENVLAEIYLGIHKTRFSIRRSHFAVDQSRTLGTKVLTNRMFSAYPSWWAASATRSTAMCDRVAWLRTLARPRTLGS